MAQSYASSLSFPYTIVEAAYEDSTIAIDDSGTAIPSADTANEEIDPLFTFDAFDSFGSVAEFLMNFDYMSLFNKVVNFIITVVDYIGGILCA